jgi:hypothetical protein
VLLERVKAECRAHNPRRGLPQADVPPAPSKSRTAAQGLALENRIAAEKTSTKEILMWLLLLLPFIGLLWVPFYNTDALPALFGFPFFYWYQLLWVPITAFLIWIVYRDGVRKGVK